MEGQMFQLLEIKQQILPVERISRRTSPPPLSQELSRKRAHIAPSMRPVPQQNLGSSTCHLPCRVHVLLFLLFLRENRMGLWMHSCLDLLPAVSRGGTAAAGAGGAAGNKAHGQTSITEIAC